MFKPNAKAKRLLREWRTVAYVYRDGIAILSEHRARVNGVYATIQTVDVYPCEITVRERNEQKVNRIVVHESEMLLGGLKAVDVCMTTTEALKGKEVLYLKWEQPCGAVFRQYHVPEISGGVSVQPDPFTHYSMFDGDETVNAWKDGRYPFTVHEPKEKAA